MNNSRKLKEKYQSQLGKTYTKEISLPYPPQWIICGNAQVEDLIFRTKQIARDVLWKVQRTYM